MPSQEKQTALDWIKDNHHNLSDWNQIIWNYKEASRARAHGRPICPGMQPTHLTPGS